MGQRMQCPPTNPGLTRVGIPISLPAALELPRINSH